MRKATTFAAASVLACMSGMANAAGVSGPIEEIDVDLHTIVVQGTTFVVPADNPVGPAIEELQEGDVIEVFFAANRLAGDGFVALRLRRKE